MKYFALVAAVAQLNLAVSAQAHGSHQDMDVEVKNDITSEALGSGIYLFKGLGGNIGVSVGEDGVFVIDDKFARFAEEIITDIRALDNGPIRYVVNTHYHGDHTGGNAEMKAAGATIVAHDNVRKRMGMTFENRILGRTQQASPEEQWPVVTFSENMTFHFNGQVVHVSHMPNAHTDGDAVIYFEQANILHMGDNYFNGMLPYVDVDGGGSLQGMIEAQSRAIDMIGEDTQIIPGHGPMATTADLVKSRDMLVDIQSRVKSRMDAGQSLDTILHDNPLVEYADLAGGFIDLDSMVRITYRSLSGK
ncbi:MAG: MBL fold metallo-hydrolase [Hyphomonadaceae bacterium]|nr:MBL fold metallo-hydrolase [Hyphomonadaceae bacterium]MBC6413037.1 MBL fold metallo-hydrolase [Hyphomonadaceae bacterium]